jgi:rod shape-determining protein MreD
MRIRDLVAAVGVLLVAVIVQTTLISRFRFVTPDLVLLISILFATTGMRREGVLLMAFTGGLVIDLLSSTVLGLRAAVFTVVAYVAIRTVNRVDLGPVAVALWVGALTLVGVVLFLLVGTLFGQGGLIGTGLGRRVVFVPVTNLLLSFGATPLLNRLISREHRGVL